MFHEGELPHHKVLLLQHCCFSIVASFNMDESSSSSNEHKTQAAELFGAIIEWMVACSLISETAKHPVQNAGQHAFATLLQGRVDYLQRD